MIPVRVANGVDLADGGALHLDGEAVVHHPHQAVAGVRVASPRVPSVVGTEVTGGGIHVSHGVLVHPLDGVSPASVVRAVRARRDTDGEVAAAQVAVVVMINGGNHHHQAILREVVVITTRLK